MIKTELYLDKFKEIASLDVREITDIPNEPTFLVNLNTREVKVPNEFQEIGVYMDHNAETIWFSVNRYFDGVDLTEKKRAIQIVNSAGSALLPITTFALPVNYNENYSENTLLLGWPITFDLTQVIGTSSLQLRFFSLDEDNTLDYNISTKPFTVKVAKGDYLTEESPNLNPPPDVLNDLVSRIENLYANDTATNLDYDAIIKDTLPTLNGVKVDRNMRFGKGSISKQDFPNATEVIPFKYNYLDELPRINGQTLEGGKDTILKLDTSASIEQGTSDPNAAQAQAVDKYVSGRLNSYYTKIDFNEGGIAYNTVNSLIDAKLDGLTFTPIAILNFTLQQQFIELKTAINKVVLNWELSKDSLSSIVKYNDKESTALTTAKTSHIITDNFDTNTVFTLSVGDGKNVVTNEVELQFVPKIYYGAASAPESYSAAFIQALPGFELRADRLTSVNVNAGTDEFIYIAIPQSYGAAAFNVGGFDGGFDSAIEVTGLYDGDVAYNLYKSTNANLGNTLVKVL